MSKQEPVFRLGDGVLVSFKASPKNTGPMTINGKVMVLVDEDGKPIYADDIKVGDRFTTIDLDTGETKRD
jgi:hypothetical protein